MEFGSFRWLNWIGESNIKNQVKDKTTTSYTKRNFQNILNENSKIEKIIISETSYFENNITSFNNSMDIYSVEY